MIFCGQIATAQLPKPIRYYPFTNASMTETINRKDGRLHGAASPTMDRFGDSKGALELTSGSYVSTPGFFEGSTYRNGFTISFWTYIDQDYPKLTGAYPWTPEDAIYRGFFADRDNETLFGFYHRGDRAVIDRFVANFKTANYKNWGVWYWDPLNFTNRKGWYQIFVVCKKNMTLLYSFYPNTQMEYALFYMGFQNLDLATSWGIGSKAPGTYSMRYLDDFKVYDQVLTKDQIEELHAQEALPNGMNEISYAFDLNMVLQTESRSLAAGSYFRLVRPSAGMEPTRQWVFEPVSGKENVFRIRMAYFDTFMAAVSTVSNGVMLEGDHGQGSLLEWYIQPANDGYFFIRSNANREMYLYVVNNNVRLEKYDQAKAPFFKWRFRPLKSQYELSQDPFNPRIPYQVIDNFNTVMGLIPETPIIQSSSKLYVKRGPYPSLLSHYNFIKDVDDAYVIRNASYYEKAIYPSDPTFKDGTIAEISNYVSYNRMYHKYIVDKPNPLGRRIRIRPILAQTSTIYSGKFPTGNVVIFQDEKAQEQPLAGEWQLFDNGTNPNANRQISTITPGIYLIRAMEDPSKCMHPVQHTFTQGTRVELNDYIEAISTSYFWNVDYERDNNGQPVRDGSYTIRTYGSDDLYLAPANRDISEEATIYLEEFNRDYVPFYKWFIEPTRDKTGGYYIENAADKLKLLKSPQAPIQKGGAIQFAYNRPSTPQQTFKWKFEKAIISTPLETGVYTIRLADFSYIGLHTQGNYTAAGTGIVEGVVTPTGTFKWKFVKNPDSSYCIILDGTDQYIHTRGNVTLVKTPLKIGPYDSRHAYAYKWLISPADEPNVYYLNLVGNPYGGYMHLADNEVQTGNYIDISQLVAAYDTAYRFRIEKAE